MMVSTFRHYNYVFIFLVLVCGCQARPLHKETRVMMGTIVEVVSPDERAADIAFTEMERIENLLSFYKTNSEISQLNTRGELAVSPETLFVLKRAGEFWQASNGSFDVTVASLVELWGFPDKRYRVPEDNQIKATLDLVGFNKVGIQGNVVKLAQAGMKIDLGAIAKGYAVDCAVKKLMQVGIKDAIINAGGDTYCLGRKFGRPWRVAIKTPRGRGFSGYLELVDKAVATSGDYERYFFIGNRRYCHIINPKTGRPANSEVNSVTVVADDCLTADALATCAFVLGKAKARDLAKKFNAQIELGLNKKCCLR